MLTEKELANLIINKLTQAVYNSISNPSEDEFYFITDEDYYQTKLVSGTNIKTINSATILGAGNIKVANTALDNISLSGKNNAIKWGMPDYSAGVSVPIPGSTPYTIPSSGYISVLASGSYMNGLSLYINGTKVFEFGDDLNSYTKEVSGIFPVSNGDTLTSENYRSGGPYENITITLYPCKGAN